MRLGDEERRVVAIEVEDASPGGAIAQRLVRSASSKDERVAEQRHGAA